MVCWFARVPQRTAAAGVSADNPPAIGPAGTVHASLMDLARYGAWHLAAARGEPCGLPAEIAGHLSTAPAGQEYALGWNVLDRRWGGGKVGDNEGRVALWIFAGMFAVAALILLLALLINSLFGPTCRFYIQTTAGTRLIAAPTRLRGAHKLLAKLLPHLESVQQT